MRALALILVLAACTHDIQTTSGADYLARHPGPATTGDIDAAVRAAARVEPTLRLPARIGLARIAEGGLGRVPESELALWQALAARHPGIGTFVLVDPMLARATAAAVAGDPDDPIIRLRLGGARQHLDAVLVYEVASQGRTAATLLAVADFTILGGAILPTRSLAAKGMANALLIDVLSGYPYGTAQAEADLAEFATTWSARGNLAQLQERASAKVVASLTDEVAAMVGRLAAALPPR